MSQFNPDHLKNIIAFFAIMLDDSPEALAQLMEKSPAYLLEKFDRYVMTCQPAWEWGLHPVLRRQVFDKYCEKWHLS